MLNVANWKDAVPLVGPEKTEPALDCDETVVKFIYLEPGQETPPHRHQHASDVIIIIEGEAEATVDGEKSRVSAGDVILNPPGTLHGIKNIGSTRLRKVTVQSPPPNRKTKRES